MKLISPNEATDIKKNNLTSRFVSTGVVSIIIIVVWMTMRGYYVLRISGIENEAHRLGIKVSEVVAMDRRASERTQRRNVTRVGELFKYIDGIEMTIIYNTELKPIWPKISSAKLSSKESVAVRALLADITLNEKVFDLRTGFLSMWGGGPSSKTRVNPLFVKLKDSSGQTHSVAKIDYDFGQALDSAWYFGLRVFVLSLLCSFILFSSLYYIFRRGIKTIEQQEETLNHQINRLSNLLTANKGLQKTMKTASARAVELNEQFLRRVGADLHDGPAQMIGFAVLRLDQVSKNEAAKSFGNEFHVVREALDGSLEEIRGISSGLVLPELETLSLEECLRKVVALHSAKSKLAVAQYYQELPSDIDLPVKICAYRFIQEGLNNAHRHGDAKKCRLSAYVKSDELVISLKDNGIGFRQSILKEGSPHLGLVGLKDRIESLGGKFSINSELGSGTALKMNISLLDEV